MRTHRRTGRASASILRKKLFTATFLLSSNNSTTNFQLHLQFFCTYVTLLKAGFRFQYAGILNIITVAGTEDADPKFQDQHISATYAYKHVRGAKKQNTLLLAT